MRLFYVCCNSLKNVNYKVVNYNFHAFFSSLSRKYFCGVLNLENLWIDLTVMISVSLIKHCPKIRKNNFKH